MSKRSIPDGANRDNVNNPSSQENKLTEFKNFENKNKQSLESDESYDRILCKSLWFGPFFGILVGFTLIQYVICIDRYRRAFGQMSIKISRPISIIN